MTAATRGKGFFAGALGGLALALLLVGAASVLPHSANPLQAASAPPQTQMAVAQSMTATLTSTAASASVSTTTLPESEGVLSASASTATATTTTTVVGPAGKATVSPAAVPGVQAASSTTTVTTATATITTTVATSATAAAAERPSSLLAVLPGEGLGTILLTVSPLVVGLLLAALVYGAYTRRQGSS